MFLAAPEWSRACDRKPETRRHKHVDETVAVDWNCFSGSQEYSTIFLAHCRIGSFQIRG